MYFPVGNIYKAVADWRSERNGMKRKSECVVGEYDMRTVKERGGGGVFKISTPK